MELLNGYYFDGTSIKFSESDDEHDIQINFTCILESDHSANYALYRTVPVTFKNTHDRVLSRVSQSEECGAQIIPSSNSESSGYLAILYSDKNRWVFLFSELLMAPPSVFFKVAPFSGCCKKMIDAKSDTDLNSELKF